MYVYIFEVTNRHTCGNNIFLSIQDILWKKKKCQNLNPLNIRYWKCNIPLIVHTARLLLYNDNYD